MVLAVVFVASSVNNILVISNAQNYCMEKGNAGDMYISSFDNGNNVDEISKWLNKCEYVKEYSKEESVAITKSDIKSVNDGKDKELTLASFSSVQKQWSKHMLVYDTDGNLLHISDGEIGVTRNFLESNNLKVGDTIQFKLKDTYKDFKISTIIMDPALGGDFTGMIRFLVSDNDYEIIKESSLQKVFNYNINVTDVDKFNKAFNNEGFSVMFSISRDLLKFSYVMSMITACILIVVGICLIVIAFLILKFTISFTLKEDFKEIGIMKAIGIRNLTIKKIYLVKYFVLVALASVLGCVLSVPVSNVMIKSVSRKMMMENAQSNIFVNILASVLMAVIVVLLCILCISKLKKITAIQAIRSGQTGERYKKKSAFSLHKKRKISTVLFMAVNDIFSNFRRFLALVLTFAVGTIIIILPLNVITSMKSDEMTGNFMMDTNASFYMSSTTEFRNETENTPNTLKAFKEPSERIKKNMADKGYDIDMNFMVMYSLSYYVNKDDGTYICSTFRPVDTDLSYMEFTKGSKPIKKDEVAISEKMAKKMNVGVGDYIYVKAGNADQRFLITGTYQNFMNMGESITVSQDAQLDGIRASSQWLYQCYLNNHKEEKNIVETLKKDFPDYEIYDAKEAMGTQLGSTLDQMDTLKIAIVIIICCVNVLITVLMMKLFIIDEKSQIACLRSIGFSVGQIRIWQTVRMGIVLIISVIIGVLVSIPLNNLVLKPIFGMMGATHMQIQVDFLEAYFIYPLILLVTICMAAYLVAGSVKRLNIMEINNAE